MFLREASSVRCKLVIRTVVAFSFERINFILRQTVYPCRGIAGISCIMFLREASSIRRQLVIRTIVVAFSFERINFILRQTAYPCRGIAGIS
jgi:hypothetical protein